MIEEANTHTDIHTYIPAHIKHFKFHFHNFFTVHFTRCICKRLHSKQCIALQMRMTFQRLFFIAAHKPDLNYTLNHLM